MSPLAILEIVIALLEGVAFQTKNKIDDIAIGDIKAAIEKLKQVHGSPVTREQLQSLRVSPLQW